MPSLEGKYITLREVTTTQVLMSLELSIIVNYHLCFRIGNYRVKKRLNAVVRDCVITVKEK